MDWKPAILRGAVARPLPIVIFVLVCGIPCAHARSMQPSVLSTQPATAPAQTQPSRGISLRQYLETEFATAPTTTDKTHAAIALARFILVTECAPSLNCLLAGRDDCGDELGSLVDQAQEYLKAAAGHLKEPDAQIEADRRVQLDERIEMLGSFAGVFGELARPASDEDAYRSTLLQACGELAIYLDDTNAGIVESARLWQGIAYRRAKRFDRAIQVLRPVITQPAFVRIGFHARLQRCHALGEAGRHVNGLWLCTRLEGMVDSWFKGEDEAARQSAADSARWVRVRLLKSWARELRADGQAERADAAESEADKIAKANEFPPIAGRRLAVKKTIPGLPPWDPVESDEVKVPVEKDGPKLEGKDSDDPEPPPPTPANN